MIFQFRSRVLIILSVFVAYISSSYCGRRQESEPEFPSHLPSPPEPQRPTEAHTQRPHNINNFNFGGDSHTQRPNRPSENSHTTRRPHRPFSAIGNGNPADSLFTRIPPLPAPGNIPPGGIFPELGQGQEPQPSGISSAMGLDNVILILVPQFKMKVKRTQKWWGANVKLSFPITVFFDKLTVPPNSPPIYFFPFGPASPLQGNIRHKRNTDPSILSLPPPESVPGGERAMLVPRLENLLTSFGFQGRACLLRAVCEVHQNKLHHTYGFLGEVLTLLFSVSNSRYVETHLPEYYKAEQLGKENECSSYFHNCTESIVMNHDEED